MVKGISRRVVVVEAPDQRFFEQAIFIVRNDAAGNGVTSRELVEDTLKALGISDLFDAICTSCEAGAGKPAPDVYLKVASLLKTEPKHCMAFEDVPMGIMAGINAGMKTCAVEDNFSANQREKKQELADYYINDYYEVL